MEVFAPKSTDIRTFFHVSRHETNKIDHATWPPLRILQCQNPIPMMCNPCAISALPWHKACARLGSKAPQICANWGQIRPISRCYAQGYRPISSCITFCTWHFKVALGTIAKWLKKSNCAQVLIRFAMTTTIQTAANLNAKWIFLACAQNKSRTVH